MPSVLGREGPGSCFTATGLLSVCCSCIIMDDIEGEMGRSDCPGTRVGGDGSNAFETVIQQKVRRRRSRRKHVSVACCFSNKYTLRV